MTIKASKVLDGKALENGEFEFELRGDDGSVISTARNDGNGSIEFAPIEYTLEDIGKHAYTVREIPGSEPGISYDTKIAEVNVTVSDNGNGTLLADASYGGENGGDITFHNSYTAPTVEDVMNDLVQTGVDALPYIGMLSACAIPSIAVIRRSRKKK